MSILGLDPGDPNNWYQSQQLGLFPVSPAVYGGGISGTCYSTHTSHPHGSPSYPPPPLQFPSQPSYPPPPQFPFQPSYPPPPLFSHTIINGHILPHQFPPHFPYPNQTHMSTNQLIYPHSQAMVEPAFPSFQPQYAMNPLIPTFQSPSVPTFVPQPQFTDPIPPSSICSMGNCEPLALITGRIRTISSSSSSSSDPQTHEDTTNPSSLLPLSDVPVQKEVLRFEKLHHQPLSITVAGEVSLAGEAATSDHHQAKQDEGQDDLMRNDNEDEFAQVDEESREREQNLEHSQVEEMSVHISGTVMRDGLRGMPAVPSSGNSMLANDEELEDDSDVGAHVSDSELEQDSEEKGDVRLTEPSQNSTYNKRGLLEKLRDMSWPENAKWVDKLTLDIEQEQPVDVHDDLTRELAFYTQALNRMRMAFEKLQLMGLPFLRPEDYYAEMVKSESQLGKVKSQFLVEMTTNLTQTSLSQVSTTLNLNFQDVRRFFESFLSNVIKLYNLSSLNCKVGAEIWPPDEGEWLDLDGETYGRVVRGFLDNKHVKELATLIIKAQKLESSTIVVDRSCCCGIVVACVGTEYSDKEHNILDELHAQGGILGCDVHVLFKSMLQFNDIDFLLNSSDGNRDCAVVAVDKIVPCTKGKRSHFICAQVENINEQESKELLNSFLCQEEYDMRSKEDLDEVEASSIPPLIPFMPFAMKLDHLDKERIIFRRSTYQKILAMEKKGAQVIECDPELPVGNLLSSTICLVWYDCINIGKNTTALDKASSCLPLYIESLATNVLILLSITFCSSMTLKTGFHKHINSVLQVTKSILQSAIDAVTHDSPREIDIPSWKEVFNSLVLLEKNLNQFHDFCVDRDLKNIWEAFSVDLCRQLKTQRVDDAANKLMTQNMAFIVCGVHSLIGQTECADSLSSILGVCAKGCGKFGVKAHGDGRTFYAYQFACISVQHVVDQIIEMSNTGGGNINVPKFKIFASHLGITTFSVSALQQFGHESLSQPIMVEVYAAPEIGLHDIFLVPGTSYVLTLNGDPTIGVKVEFTILASLQIEYQIDPLDVKAVVATATIQLQLNEATELYKGMDKLLRAFEIYIAFDHLACHLCSIGPQLLIEQFFDIAFIVNFYDTNVGPWLPAHDERSICEGIKRISRRLLTLLTLHHFNNKMVQQFSYLQIVLKKLIQAELQVSGFRSWILSSCYCKCNSILPVVVIVDASEQIQQNVIRIVLYSLFVSHAVMAQQLIPEDNTKQVGTAWTFKSIDIFTGPVNMFNDEWGHPTSKLDCMILILEIAKSCYELQNTFANVKMGMMTASYTSNDKLGVHEATKMTTLVDKDNGSFHQWHITFFISDFELVHHLFIFEYCWYNTFGVAFDNTMVVQLVCIIDYALGTSLHAFDRYWDKIFLLLAISTVLDPQMSKIIFGDVDDEAGTSFGRQLRLEVKPIL